MSINVCSWTIQFLDKASLGQYDFVYVQCVPWTMDGSKENMSLNDVPRTQSATKTETLSPQSAPRSGLCCDGSYCADWVLVLMGTYFLLSPTLQRQNTEISKQIFPEKEYRGPSPYFHIHASVSDLYIPTIGVPILLKEICRPILGLYKSLTDTWMLKLGLKPRYFQKRNT